MPITQTITTLPAAPDPASDTPSNFSTKAAASVLAQKAMVVELQTWTTQVNALAAAMSAIAAGTAIAIPYTFSTTTTDADPGAGYLRLDNATQNIATTLRADLAGADGVTYTDVLALMDDSTSTIKGFIQLQNIADATKWLLFSVTSMASPAGYRNITVACVASSGTNPFANGDSITLEFTRAGDKGDTGATGPAIGTFTEIFKTASADSPLTAAQASGTIVSNYGMTDADCTIDLPTAAEGLSFVAILPTVRARFFKFHCPAAQADKIYLLGVAGADDGNVGVASGYATGASASFFTFKASDGGYDWFCIPIFGTWVAS